MTLGSVLFAAHEFNFSIHDKLPIDMPRLYQILRCGREGIVNR